MQLSYFFKLNCVVQIGFPITLSLAIPFFGYNSSSSTTTDKEELIADEIKVKIEQKLNEADQLFLVNKYEEVVHLLEEYKVILLTCLFCFKSNFSKNNFTKVKHIHLFFFFIMEPISISL